MALTRKPHYIDISQAVILDKLYRYYASQPNRDRAFLEAINPDGGEDNGHCAGFAVLALYGSWLSLFPQDHSRHLFPQDNYAWFEELLIKIARTKDIAILNVHGEIDRFFGIVRYYQFPTPIHQLQSDVEVLLTDTRNRRFVVEYKVTGIFSAAALVKSLFLSEDDVYVQASILSLIASNHKMVVISSERHVTGLICDRYQYYHYDANAKYGRVAYFDLHPLAKHIMKSHFGDKKTGTLSFRVIDTESAVKRNYPSQASLLSALYTVFPVTFDYYPACLFEALNLSAISASVELVRFYTDLLMPRRGSLPLLGGKNLTSLHFAAAAGCVGAVDLLLKLGVSVNVCDACLSTPLLMAAFMNRSAVARYLLDAGADPNCQTVYHASPLLIALRRRHFEIVDILFSSGRLIVTMSEYEQICSIQKREPANRVIQSAIQRIISRDVRADENVTAWTQKEGALLAPVLSCLQACSLFKPQSPIGNSYSYHKPLDYQGRRL